MIKNVFKKPNVSLHEYEMHLYIEKLNIVNVPKIISYDKVKKILEMENINNMSIADYYGENVENIHEEMFEEIQNIVRLLYQNNVAYPDITGYNFIEYDDKIWIIDFEHSEFIKPKDKTSNKYKFIIEFINGTNKWNKDFL